MRLILKFTVLAMVAGLFFLQTSVSAQDKDIHDLSPGNSNNSKNSTIVFPEIDGWEKGEIQKFPTAELGYSVGYRSEEGGIVTIYVYNAGKTNIPNGIGDQMFEREIERAKNDIIQAGKAGTYENVKEVKEDRITLGGENGQVKSLYSLFNFSIRGREVDSEIYLFGYQNNFIKIRATRPKAKNNAENKALTNFLRVIDKLFSE